MKKRIDPTQINLEYIENNEILRKCARPDGAPCTYEHPILVNRLRIGRWLGFTNTGKIVAELLPYDTTGSPILPEMTPVTVAIPEKLQDAADRFKVGEETDDDLNDLRALVLDSEQAKATFPSIVDD